MEPISLPILRYAADTIEALQSADEGGDISINNIQIYWYGDPTAYYIVADEYGGYGLTIKEDSDG